MKQKIETYNKYSIQTIPNILCEDVPSGRDENSNVEISKTGSIPKFNFEVKSHYDLGE